MVLWAVGHWFNIAEDRGLDLESHSKKAKLVVVKGRTHSGDDLAMDGVDCVAYGDNN